MGSEVYVPVQEIARTVKQVPLEFVTTEDVQKTLRRRPEDEEDTLQIPTIDLGPLLDNDADEQLKATVNGQIGRACEDWGFFQAINHGIPEPLLEQALEVVEGFFNLPLEEKMAYSMKPGQPEGYGSIMKPDVRPWKDLFRHVVRPRPPPDRDAQPKSPAYREVMGEYTEEVVKLGRLLTSALSEYFGLESNALQTALENERNDYPGLAMILNFYPKCPEPDRVLGITAHRDTGSLTVLLQNEVEGLQVQRGERWVDVKPVKNALVISISNQLQILTNGRLKSTEHRALANNTTTRISIAAFCAPGTLDVVVGPLPHFVDETHPCLYPSISYFKHISAFMNMKLDFKPNYSLD